MGCGASRRVEPVLPKVAWRRASVKASEPGRISQLDRGRSSRRARFADFFTRGSQHEVHEFFQRKPKNIHQVATQAVANIAATWVDHLVSVTEHNILSERSTRKMDSSMGGHRMAEMLHAHCPTYDPRWTRDLVEKLDTHVAVPMRVIPALVLKAHGRIPRSSDRCTVTGTPGMFIVFVSHRWWKSTLDVKEAHPDDEKGTKFGLVWRGLEKISEAHGVPIEEIYLWVDFACINQANLCSHP